MYASMNLFIDYQFIYVLKLTSDIFGFNLYCMVCPLHLMYFSVELFDTLEFNWSSAPF